MSMVLTYFCVKLCGNVAPLYLPPLHFELRLLWLFAEDSNQLLCRHHRLRDYSHGHGLNTTPTRGVSHHNTVKVTVSPNHIVDRVPFSRTSHRWSPFALWGASCA